MLPQSREPRSAIDKLPAGSGSSLKGLDRSLVRPCVSFGPCRLPRFNSQRTWSLTAACPSPGAPGGYLAHPFTNQMDLLLIASCFSELWHSQIKEYKGISRVYLDHAEHTPFIFS